MRVKGGKRILSLMIVAVMLVTMTSWTELETVKVQAADNAPSVTYTFDQIVEMSNIPVMNLTMSDSGKYDTLKTDKSVKQNISTFELVNTNGKGSDIYLEATVDDETGETEYPLTIKGRGNSSWTMPTGKKPYNIKFDSKQNLLGMGKAKSWCLISNWVDTTYMRNYLAYQLACQLGMGTPDCEMVALCIDGTFEGIYLLTEKVGLNDYRTEIPESETDGDINGDGVVTEIIVEADIRADEYSEPGRFKSANNVSYVPKDPEAEDLADSELEMIQDELNEMEAAIMTGTNYEDYIDVDSWVDAYIVNELAKNPDFGFGHQNCYASTYLYFREGGKVYAGPVWDFDIAYGRNDYSQMESEGYRDIASTTGYLSKATKYYKELFENTDFEEHVIKRWKEIRETILPTWMNETFKEGYESAEVLNPIDVEIWGDYAGRVAGSYDMGRDPLEFDEEVAYVQNFINERVAWLDEQWNVDEVTKKFSGSWTRWDVEAADDYTSYEELVDAVEIAEAKTSVADIWDGGYGGKEKSGTDIVEKGSVQTAIPGVTLESPITITMERQRGEYDWSSDTTHAYDIWKDGEASQGFGGVKDTLEITQSGRYVGLTTASYYVGDTTVTMGQNNVQVYIIDVGTDGSVTLYDGSVKLSYEARVATVVDTNYGSIEETDNGYKVLYKADGSGNVGTTIGGTGNKQFRIYLPDECISDNDQSGNLTITTRPSESNYADVLLKQEVTYVQAEGERPVSWNVEGDAVVFDEVSQQIIAQKAGTAVITATAAGGLTSSVTITVTEKAAAGIEYDEDPTLGKYYGNTDEVVLSATESEKGTWATMAPENLTRLSFTYKMTQEEVDSASTFVWQTQNGDEIIGGAADYYVYVNGKTLFAATADTLDYAIAGFDSENTIQISNADLPENLYAYMKGLAGSTENQLSKMTDLVQVGTNTVDIFIVTEDGGATVLPYLGGTIKIADTDSTPIEPGESVNPDDSDDTEEPDDSEESEDTEEPDDSEEPVEPEDILVESIEITNGNISLEETKSVVLSVTVLPEDATDKTVIWESSDENVAAVDENGKVTAVSEGTATITVTCEKDETIKDEIQVTVTKMSYEFGFVLEGTSVEIEDLSTMTLETEFTPSNIPDKTVTWSTSDESVVTVDETGTITAHKPGTATITAVSAYDNKKATVSVKVVPTEVKVTITAVDQVMAGEETELEAALDKEVADMDVVWSIVTGEEYASLSGNVLKAEKIGTITVKAASSYNEECYATKIITITNPNVESIEIAEGDITLEETKSKTLSVNVLPEDAGAAAVTWESSDETVAVVNENGKVTAVSEGTATITAVYEKDESIKDEIQVTVTKISYEFGFVLEETSVEMEDLSTMTLETEFTPSNIPDKTVTWSTSDESVVSVDETGTITAHKPGTATITAVSTYDSKEAAVTINVIPTTVTITINCDDQVVRGNTIELNASVNKSVSDDVEWSIVSGDKYASLDGNVLYANKVGTVTVKAVSVYNNECYATKEIIIANPPAESIEITDGDITLVDTNYVTLSVEVLPEDAEETSIAWTTSNTKVAVVSNSGKVTATGTGTATITATCASNSALTDSIQVTVLPKTVEVTIDADETLNVGEETELKATLNKSVCDTTVSWSIVDGEEYASLDGNILEAVAPGVVTVKAVSNYNEECFATASITIEEVSESPMVPGTKLEEPIKVSMELQRGQYEWSFDTTHAYDMWKDGEATQGFSRVKNELTITEAGRYVGLTSASYYVGDITVTMGENNVQVYIIDVANDGSVTVYDGALKVNYFERTSWVVDTTYANVEATDDGYLLTYKSDGTGNAGKSVSK